MTTAEHTLATDLKTIHTDCGEACDDARGLAAYDGVPYVVWRCGDRFTAMREGSRVEKVWLDADQPIRPVALYDPDGTEYAG